MRVLAITKLYPPVGEGGYEIQSRAIVNALSAQSHEVRVLTTDLRADQAQSNPAVDRSLAYARYVSAPDARRSIAHTLSAVRTVRSTLARFNPDVVCIFQGSGLPQAALAAVLQTNLPVMMRIGDYWLNDLYRVDPFMKSLLTRQPSPAGLMVKAINRYSTQLHIRPARPVAVAWVSDFLRARIELPSHLAVTAETNLRMRTPNAAAAEALYIEHRPPIDPVAPRLLFAGRVVAEKGADLVVRAAAALRPRMSGITVRVAGACSNDAARELRQVAAEAGFTDHLVLLGQLEADALATELGGADLFVMPSLWEEPGGLALWDAASAGVPVVAARSGGMPEVLHPGEHALFFERGDVNELADAIQDVIEHPGPAERRRRAARAFYETETERFDKLAVCFIETAAKGGRV